MSVPSGYSAIGMIGFTDRGDYSPIATYVINDLVHHSGTIWKCRIDDTIGIEPRNNSVNWEVFIDYSDLSNIKSDFLSLGYINQIPYPYYDGASKTTNGITWTVNDDKSITINGTATQTSYFILMYNNVNAPTPNTPYAMSLGSDISSSKLCLQIIYKAQGGSEKSVNSSSKAETEFTITDSNIVTMQFRLVVLNGQTIDNLTVYPYIRKLTDGKSNRVLTEETSASVKWNEMNVLGAKNLLKISATSQVKDGVTFTINDDDGSITVDGTATTDTYLIISRQDFGKTYMESNYVGNSDYILSGLPQSTKFYLTYTVSTKITALIVKSGYTIDNVTVYPMIRLKSIKDDTYVPYAMTNRELTEKIEYIMAQIQQQNQS